MRSVTEEQNELYRIRLWRENQLLPRAISACENAQNAIRQMLQGSTQALSPFNVNKRMMRIMEHLHKLALAVQTLHSQLPPTDFEACNSHDDEDGEDEGDEDEGDESSAGSYISYSSSSSSSSSSERNAKVRFALFFSIF